MTYPYGTKGMPTAGAAPGLPARSSVPRGEAMFALPGTYQWTVPDGVTSVCAVAVGGGGGCFTNYDGTNRYVSSGGGGALAWGNNLPVIPGETITIVVGAGGVSNSSPGSGGISYFRDNSTVSAGGGAAGVSGATAPGGIVVAGSGGAGGAGTWSTATTSVYASAGAAGGYSGNGGAGSAAAGNPGIAGGGGGGSGGVASGSVGGSGGVGLYGQTTDGSGGPSTAGSNGGGGGSGGQSGTPGDLNYSVVGRSGCFGAGGGGFYGSGQPGAQGAVRVLWGDGRAFPSTDVGPS